MRRIDAHVHLYPPEINRAPAQWAQNVGEGHWATLCTRIRKNGRPVQGFPDLDALLREMDASGVERAVLQSWYWERHDTCVLQNRFYAACLRAHPDRLSAFAAFHASAGSATVGDEIKRVCDEGFIGLGELSPHSQRVAINDTVWREALALAGRLRLLVNLHVTEPHGRAYPGRVETPLVDFISLARDFPETTFILAHWGARLPLDPVLGRDAVNCGNIYYDTAASPLLYPAAVVREMIEAVGAGHLLYGSDHPLNLYPSRDEGARIGALIEDPAWAGLGLAEKTALFSGTMLGLIERQSR